MPERALPTHEILTLLESGPSRIVAAVKDLSEQQLHAAPAAGEWSANEVLAHLRSCADVWGDCIIRILHEEGPTIRAVNPRTWIQGTDYLEQKFQPSLQAFIAQRKSLLKVLRGLEPKTWSHAAKITGAGKPIVRTVQSYAQWMATHERPHLKQIERIASAIRK